MHSVTFPSNWHWLLCIILCFKLFTIVKWTWGRQQYLNWRKFRRKQSHDLKYLQVQSGRRWQMLRSSHITRSSLVSVNSTWRNTPTTDTGESIAAVSVAAADNSVSVLAADNCKDAYEALDAVKILFLYLSLMGLLVRIHRTLCLIRTSCFLNHLTKKYCMTGCDCPKYSTKLVLFKNILNHQHWEIPFLFLVQKKKMYAIVIHRNLVISDQDLREHVL